MDTQELTPLKKRNRWLAAFLSLLLPGLGELYDGAAQRAVIVWAIMLAALATLVASFRIEMPALLILLGFMSGALALVILRLVSIIQAFLMARRNDRVAPKRYQRVWVYMMILLVGLATQNGAVGLARAYNACPNASGSRSSVVYSIPSESMAPALKPGEWILAEPQYFCRHEPQRGDIAVFLAPRDRTVQFVKRIVGLPGDRIQIVAGQIHLNGAPVAREWLESAIHDDSAEMPRSVTLFTESLTDGIHYTVAIQSSEAKLENTPEIVVPDGQYFVLGDDRDRSLDSRMPELGPIPRELILDRPVLVLWSTNWNRIGSWVQ